MPTVKPLVLLSLAALLMGCNQHSVSASGGSGRSSASSSTAGSAQVRLNGSTGHAELDGDRIDLRDGQVFVNDVALGPVPQGASVHYQLMPEGKTLFVGGERRALVK